MVKISISERDEGKYYLIEARGSDLYGDVKFAVWQTGNDPKASDWYTPTRVEKQYYTLMYLPNAGRGEEYNVHIYSDGEYIDEKTFIVKKRNNN